MDPATLQSVCPECLQIHGTVKPFPFGLCHACYFNTDIAAAYRNGSKGVQATVQATPDAVPLGGFASFVPLSEAQLTSLQHLVLDRLVHPDKKFTDEQAELFERAKEQGILHNLQENLAKMDLMTTVGIAMKSVLRQEAYAAPRMPDVNQIVKSMLEIKTMLCTVFEKLGIPLPPGILDPRGKEGQLAKLQRMLGGQVSQTAQLKPVEIDFDEEIRQRKADQAFQAEQQAKGEHEARLARLLDDPAVADRDLGEAKEQLIASWRAE